VGKVTSNRSHTLLPTFVGAGPGEVPEAPRAREDRRLKLRFSFVAAAWCPAMPSSQLRQVTSRGQRSQRALSSDAYPFFMPPSCSCSILVLMQYEEPCPPPMVRPRPECPVSATAVCFMSVADVAQATGRHDWLIHRGDA